MLLMSVDAAQGLRGDCQGAVPVFVEGPRQIVDDGAAHKYIVVGELRRRINLEILIADIAAADEGDRIIRDQQLIVHPIVKPRMIEQILRRSYQWIVAAVRKRVKDPHFDVGPISDCKYLLVARY